MSRSIKKGATDQTIYIEVLDSTSTTGGRKTGLVFNTASLTAYYVRNRGTATAITLATLVAPDSAHSDGGFKEIDATNMPGIYRLDLPDAAVATGADSVVVTLRGATGMAQVSSEIQLIDNTEKDIYDRLGAPAGASVSADVASVQSDTNDIQTRLPAALVSGRIPSVVEAMAADVVTASAIAADAITAAKIADGAIDAATFALGAITAAAIAADAITDAKVASDVTIASVTGSVGSVVGLTVSNLDAAISSRASAVDLATAASYIDTEVAAIQADTNDIQARLPAALVLGRIDASVGAMATDVLTASAIAADAITDAKVASDVTIASVTGSVGSIATGGITAGSFAAGAIDAAAIATDAIGSAELAASAITEIQAGLSTLDAAGVRAAVGLASANLDAQLAAIDDFLDTEIGAIKAKTDNLPVDPADASDIATSFGVVNATLATMSGYIDTEIAAIKAKTDNLPASPAAVSDIPTADQNADALLDRANGVETGLTPRGYYRLAASALFGKASGLGTTTAIYRDFNDVKNRLVATVDEDGNRSSMTRDAT